MEGILFVLSGKRKHSHNENIKNIGKNLNVFADWRYISTVKISPKAIHRLQPATHVRHQGLWLTELS